MKSTQRLEVRVGAFVISGLILLIIFVFIIGDVSTLWRPGYHVNIQFETANGIVTGAPVQYAGVEVGKVKSIYIEYAPTVGSSPQIKINIQLPSEIIIRSADIASISTFGLLGEKYLEITPGSGEGEIIEPGGLLIGKKPVSTEQIIERSADVLSELQEALEGINNIVGEGGEGSVYLQETIREAHDASRQWRILGERLQLAMLHAESGEGNLGKLIYDDELYKRIELFVEDLRAHPWKLLLRSKSKKTPKAEN